MKLIDEAGKWYRMFVMQALIAIGALQVALLQLTDAEASQPVPFLHGLTWRHLGILLTVILAMAGGYGRMIKQDSVSGPATL